MFFLRFRLLLLLFDIWRFNFLNWRLHLRLGWWFSINDFFTYSNNYLLLLRSLSRSLWYEFRFWRLCRLYLGIRCLDWLSRLWRLGSLDNRLNCSSTWLSFFRCGLLLHSCKERRGSVTCVGTNFEFLPDQLICVLLPWCVLTCCSWQQRAFLKS